MGATDLGGAGVHQRRMNPACQGRPGPLAGLFMLSLSRVGQEADPYGRNREL